MRTILLASLLCPTQLAFSQTNSRFVDFNHHMWYSYSGDHPFSSGPWGLHFDTQWRRSDLGIDWQQYQFRPGLNYAVSPSVLLTVGYAFTKSYPYGDYPSRDSIPEHRIYQQGLIKQKWGRVPLQHRIRLEQRFVQYADPQPRTWTYQNRFRYQLKADIPLSKNEIGNAVWYVPVYNEILIGIPPNYGARPFDQNRLFAGIGRAFGAAKVEAGYMNQFISQRNGRIFELNNTLFVTITSDVSIPRFWSD